MDTIIPAVQAVNEAARTRGVLIIYTTTAYEVVDGPNSDMGLWNQKIPLEALLVGTEDVAIDDRIAPREGELVVVKKRASAFHGTHVSSYLTAHGVDTVILTGVTMAGCVRHTAEDAIAEGFRPIVIREAVGDRVPGVVQWNLFDIDAKFGDVVSLDSAVQYLEGLPAGTAGAGGHDDCRARYPWRRSSSNAASSPTTSPYFASMSNRLASCGPAARSATASRGTITR